MSSSFNASCKISSFTDMRADTFSSSACNAETSRLAPILRRWRILDCDAAREVLLDIPAKAQSECYRRNIESYIGTLNVPVGIAGPLRINGEFTQGEHLVPLATTEATLVASYSRGARLITAAGGCTTRILAEGVTRTPAFVFENLSQASRFIAWVESLTTQLQPVVETTTRYGKLKRLYTVSEGNHVYLCLEFTTGNAAGQNMVTFAADAICQYILSNTPVKPSYWFLEANFSGDKKASAQTLATVRGKRVIADVVISKSLIHKRLGCDPHVMVDYWRIAALGGVLSGTLGIQGHYANGLAALYLACGQDVACVAESAIGATRLELTAEGDIYAAVTLPGIMVGTVGGGTHLPTQKACLDILNLSGPNSSRALAEICAGVALSGELSIVAALSAGDFARAHHAFARGNKTAQGGNHE